MNNQAFAVVRTWMAQTLNAPKAVIDALERFIADSAISFREMAAIAGHSLIGNHNASSATPEAIGVTGGLEFFGTDIQRSALTGDITAAAGSNTTAFRNGTALSVLGNATNASTVLADIVAASDNQVFRRSGTSLGFGAVNLASSNAVSGVLAVANGGTGQSSYTDGQLLIGNTSTGGLTKATLTAGTNVTITNAGGSITIAASGGSGTVSSVGLSAPSIFTVSGSPVTTSGTLTFSLNTQSANLVFAGPTTGAAATPTFRALVAADLPNNGANPTATASDTAVNGSATTWMRSDAAPAVQKGSSSAFGVVKVDGTTIVATGGVLSTASGGGGAITLIASSSPSGTGTVTFSSIPGTYKHLQLVGVARSAFSATADDIWIRLNGDTGNNYSRVYVGSNGGAAPSAGQDNSVSHLGIGTATGATASSNFAGLVNTLIPMYAATTFTKGLLSSSAFLIGMSSGQIGNFQVDGVWNNTGAINSITIFLNSGSNFASGTSFSLYGWS